MQSEKTTIRCLLVEDDETFRDLLQMRLERAGLSVDSVESSQEGFEVLKRRIYDLLILDFHLPDFTGPALLSSLGEHRPETVLFLSSDLSHEARQEAALAGADEFLSKSLPSQELERILEFQIAKLRARTQLHSERASQLKESARAKRVQKRLGTGDIRATPYTVALTNQPAKTISGDFFFALSPSCRPWELWALIADVSGKGTGAALYTPFLRAWMQTTARNETGYSSAKLLEKLHKDLLEITSGTEDFVTAQLFRLDPVTRTIQFSNAGHPLPVVKRAGKPASFLPGEGTPLGMFENTRYRESESYFDRGDRLILYTDGISEAGASQGTILPSKLLLTWAEKEAKPEGFLTLASRFQEGPLRDDALVTFLDFPALPDS